MQMPCQAARIGAYLKALTTIRYLARFKLFKDADIKNDDHLDFIN